MLEASPGPGSRAGRSSPPLGTTRRGLGARRAVYLAAKQKHPRRWTRATRAWEHPAIVTLNPERATLLTSTSRRRMATATLTNSAALTNSGFGALSDLQRLRAAAAMLRFKQCRHRGRPSRYHSENSALLLTLLRGEEGLAHPGVRILQAAVPALTIWAPASSAIDCAAFVAAVRPLRSEAFTSRSGQGASSWGYAFCR